MTVTSSRDLAALPKAHLHLHLEAAMRHSTLVDLSAKYGTEVPVVAGYGSFTEFAAMYLAAADVLRERDDWYRLADELLSDHAAEGAVYVELIFDAVNYRYRGQSDQYLWDILFEVFDELAPRHGVAVGWMSGFDRSRDDVAAATEAAQFAVRNRERGIVSFGMHNEEVGHPPEHWVAPMRVARDGGLQVTPHVGELDEGRHVGTALRLLSPTRLLHGVRAIEQPGLLAELAEAGVCLDVCPTSNVLLSVFPSYAQHGLPTLLDAGVLCTLNADDPLLFDITLLGEYQRCRDELGLDDNRLAGIARTSIEFASLSPAAKASALAAIETWLSS